MTDKKAPYKFNGRQVYEDKKGREYVEVGKARVFLLSNKVVSTKKKRNDSESGA